MRSLRSTNKVLWRCPNCDRPQYYNKTVCYNCAQKRAVKITGYNGQTLQIQLVGEWTGRMERE